jgi:hypothetical protein
MAALSNRGNGNGARTGSASTRPAARGNGTAAAGTTAMTAAIEAATSSTDASDASALGGAAPALLPGAMSPRARVVAAQVVLDRGGAGAASGAASAAASCCDRGGRTMNGMMALTSMIPEIT